MTILFFLLNRETQECCDEYEHLEIRPEVHVHVLHICELHFVDSLIVLNYMNTIFNMLHAG